MSIFPTPINRIIVDYVDPRIKIMNLCQNVNIVDWFTTLFNISREQILEYNQFGWACTINEEMMEWVYKNYSLTYDEIIKSCEQLPYAYIYGRLDIMQWVYSKYPDDVRAIWKKLIDEAIDNLAGDIIIWLLSEFGSDNLKKYIPYVCSNDLIDVVKWIHSKVKLSKEDFEFLDDRETYDHPGTLDYDVVGLLDSQGRQNGISDHKSKKREISWIAITKDICEQNHLKLLTWFCNEFKLSPPADINPPHLFTIACGYGYIEIAKWLKLRFNMTRNQCISKDGYEFAYACESGYFEVVKWLHEEFRLTMEECSTMNGYALQHANENMDVVAYLKNVIGIK